MNNDINRQEMYNGSGSEKKVKIKRISPLWSRTHRDANEPKNATTTTTTTSLSQKSFLIKKFRWWWWWGGVFLKRGEKKSERKTCSFLFFYFFWGKNCFSLRWQLASYS